MEVIISRRKSSCCRQLNVELTVQFRIVFRRAWFVEEQFGLCFSGELWMHFCWALLRCMFVYCVTCCVACCVSVILDCVLRDMFDNVCTFSLLCVFYDAFVKIFLNS